MKLLITKEDVLALEHGDEVLVLDNQHNRILEGKIKLTVCTFLDLDGEVRLERKQCHTGITCGNKSYLFEDLNSYRFVLKLYKEHIIKK